MLLHGIYTPIDPKGVDRLFTSPPQYFSFPRGYRRPHNLRSFFALTQCSCNKKMSRERERRGDSVPASVDSRVMEYFTSFGLAQGRERQPDPIDDREEGELEDDEEDLRRRALLTIHSPQSERSAYGRHLYLRGYYDRLFHNGERPDRERSVDRHRRGGSLERRREESAERRRREESVERRRREESVERHRREESVERRRREASLERRRDESAERRRRDESAERQRREDSADRRRREDSADRRRREGSAERRRQDEAAERRRRESQERRLREGSRDRRLRGERAGSREQHRNERASPNRRREDRADSRDRRRDDRADLRDRRLDDRSDSHRPSGGRAVALAAERKLPQDFTAMLTSWMTKGIPTAESKAIQELFKPSFVDDAFSVSPPVIDDWLAVRIKEHQSRKSIEAEERDWLAMQFKVMDIVAPLLNIYSLRTANGGSPDENDAVWIGLRAALMQWGRAYHYVTRHRRHNISVAGTKSLKHLLDKPDSYASSETLKHLFGKSFEDATLEFSRRQMTLRQAEAEEDAATAGPSRNTRQRANFDPGQSNSTRGKNSGQGKPRGRGRGSRYDYNFSSSFIAMPVIERGADVSLIGGRLRLFHSNWEFLCKDKWISNSIRQGFSIDFLAVPSRGNFLPSTIAMSREMEAVCDREVEELLAKKAVIEIEDDSKGFLSALFVVPKKSGGFRPIVNLKALNKFVRYEHFKMEGLETVKNLVRKGDWMVKLDLKDAYLTVPILPAHQKFLRFVWRKRFYQFSCLPFGLSSAPRLFTKILKVVVAFLRERGLRLVIYLDDILILNEDKLKLESDFSFVVSFLESLGFLVNWEKTVSDPSQSIEYLGVIIDSLSMRFCLPEDKVAKIKNLCSKILSKTLVSLKDLASVLGNLVWAISSVPFAQAHYRALQNFYIRQIDHFRGDLSAKCPLSDQSKQDLSWWVSYLDIVNGKPFSSIDPDIIIHSDASLMGWGACSNGITARGPWTSVDRDRHINELELLGAFNAIQCFAQQSHDVFIRIFLDNNTAVCYLNKHGGTRSQNLTTIAKAISNWCEPRGISVQAVYLPGSLNVIADKESRSAPDASDWMLRSDLFSRISDLWPVDIDLFASSWNAQLPKFVSWKPQPGAYALDAFSLNWGSFFGYLFPPFSLISRCLVKLRREKASAVLVCPVWPSQPFFPILLEMACDVPRVFPSGFHTLTSPVGEPHPLGETIKLAAWKLSGNPSMGREFRRQWSNYSWPAHAHPRMRLTSRRGEIGVIGVWGGIMIPWKMI